MPAMAMSPFRHLESVRQGLAGHRHRRPTGKWIRRARCIRTIRRGEARGANGGPGQSVAEAPGKAQTGPGYRLCEKIETGVRRAISLA